MVESTLEADRWTVEIEGLPGFDLAMQRVYAWFNTQILDRPPIRFQAHNALGIVFVGGNRERSRGTGDPETGREMALGCCRPTSCQEVHMD